MWISGKLDPGGQNGGNGTTSCPKKHEEVVWETGYKASCRTRSAIRSNTATRVSGPARPTIR